MGGVHRRTLVRAFDRIRRRYRHRRRNYLRLNGPGLSDERRGGNTAEEEEEGEKELEEMGSIVIIHSSESSSWDSGSESGSDDEDEDCSDEDGDGPTTSGKELSSSLEDRLNKYFDPYTSILYEGVLDSTTPVKGWERRMEWRIRHGRGLSAWIDWVVDTGVRWVQRVVREET